MKDRMHHLQLFSCPSPPTICRRAIEVSQYILPSVPVPFEETTNAGAFRGYTVALFIVPRLTAPSYLCPLLQALFVTGARGCKKTKRGAGKLFIVRTGARRGTARRRAAPFTSPLSVTQTNVQSRGRAVQISLPSSVKLLSMEEWWWARGRGGGEACVVFYTQSPLKWWEAVPSLDGIRSVDNSITPLWIMKGIIYIFFFTRVRACQRPCGPSCWNFLLFGPCWRWY